MLTIIPNVVSCSDDILMTDKHDAEHLIILNSVLKKLKGFSLQLKLSKCRFLEFSVE